MTGRCVLVWLLAAACSGSAPPTAAMTKGSPVSQLPRCTSAAQLAPLDGQRVVLVGIYRKRLVAKKKGQPATQFYGYAQLELTGKATDYDPSAWDGALAIVRIGTDKRSEDELAKLADQPVAVEGRLVLHPPIADPNVASPTPGPTLFDVGAITAP
ncbi:MAG: hypothetical protein ABIY55_30220 [Kofleriaceae bacterium]